MRIYATSTRLFQRGSSDGDAFQCGQRTLDLLSGFQCHGSERGGSGNLEADGKMPTIAGWAFKKNIGQPFIYPDNNLSYCANFLSMMFQVPAVDYEPAEEFVKALNVLFILHADHEQNCSTSTVRLVGVVRPISLPRLLPALPRSGAITRRSKSGSFGNADEIHNDGGNIDKYVDMAKDKDSGFRLMGFGHRVYKNFDPRALIIKNYCDQILKSRTS